MMSDMSCTRPTLSRSAAWLGVVEDDAGRVEGNGAGHALAAVSILGLLGNGGQKDTPDDALKLLLPDVGRDLAVDLAGAQRHGQGLGHVFLYGRRDVVVLAGRADPDLGGPAVLELAGAQLAKLGAGPRARAPRWVGKRSSRAASTPSVCVVLMRMHVCWGVTTASIIEARS